MSADPDAVDAALAVLGGLGQAGVPLGPLTTYRVGGPAAVFVTIRQEADLVAVAAALAESDLPCLVVGNGSNMLVADDGFAGLALHLDGLDDIQFGSDQLVRAGGGSPLPVVARRTAAEGLTGFEWAVGVPGSVGGAVRMNAGGHGSDMAASLVRARVFDLRRGEERERSVEDLRLGYRRSAIVAHEVVVWAELRLAPGDAEEGLARISEIVRWRRANQPGGQNAGSVFTNPPGDSAGRLIDMVGLKGHRRGSAFVSDKHANFVQADEGGSADDVRALIEEVQQMVETETGTRLHPELRLIGFPSEPSTRGQG
ncbi:MAG: UDP-N-acetylmuramate dehydrogenase [Acidimicrobiales bacterium]